MNKGVCKSGCKCIMDKALMMFRTLVITNPVQQENELARELSDVKIQAQIDTLNLHVNMCRNTYETVLLNQISENTELLKDVKEYLSKPVNTKYTQNTSAALPSIN